MAIALRSVEKQYAEDEYFEFERTSAGRWEYVGGEIRAIAGGTADHSAIGMNVGRTLGNALVPRGCRVFGPDMSVVCGPLTFHRGKTDPLTNPLVIVEVLSPSTEEYDRSQKFEHYQTIPTLNDYLLVEPEATQVVLYSRRDEDWDAQTVAGRENSVYLPSVDVRLASTDVYALIELRTE